ncbi:hypothetical protein NW761_011518 [Fusarium oxysporum]|nr:hypothetical protein NW758_010548 [Fusarium oxysporum]KAJ4079268.1 hypothetical protein NW761_011518 [Fusarium oxysporum]
MVSATERLGQAVGLAMGTATENLIGAAATVGSKALISATSSFLTTVAHNVIENKFYGTHYGLFEGAGTAFGSGAAMGALGDLVSAGSHLVKGGESAKYARASLLPRVKTCLRELEMGVQGKDGDGQSVSGAGEEFQGLIEYGWAQ